MRRPKPCKELLHTNGASFLKLRIRYEKWCWVSCVNPNSSPCPQGKEPWALQRALDQPCAIARHWASKMCSSSKRPIGPHAVESCGPSDLQRSETWKGKRGASWLKRYGGCDTDTCLGTETTPCAAHLGVSEIMMCTSRDPRGNSGRGQGGRVGASSQPSSVQTYRRASRAVPAPTATELIRKLQGVVSSPWPWQPQHSCIHFISPHPHQFGARHQ